MSVVKEKRRQGIGREILNELCRRAHKYGYERVILETTGTWQEVITFNERLGFRKTHYVDDDVYFELDLKGAFDS